MHSVNFVVFLICCYHKVCSD